LKAALFGNGINIKFGGKNYLNKKIIRRGSNFLRQDHKVYELVPPETLKFFDYMFHSAPDFIRGLYDEVADDCPEELTHFKQSYSNRPLVDIGDIGLEDYFLMLHLIYKYNRLKLTGTEDEQWFTNAKEKQSAECLRDMFLMGIYNHGKINRLYQRYSQNFVRFLNTFDKIFTTNYDSNLDYVFEGTVFHIHGQFDVLDQLYDPSSLRNSLSDHQYTANNLTNLPMYLYLHSTALMNYSGKNKFDHIVAENNLSILTIGDIEKVPDSMIDPTTKKLALEAAEIHEQNPQLSLQSMPAINEYLNFSGEMSIIGLSAANDNHIFSDHKGVSYTYYYFSDSDLALAQAELPSNASFSPVSALWNQLD
jgi:hypothetical protein